MPKLATDDMLDGGLDKVATTTLMTVCNGQPTSHADIAVKKLASVVMAGGDFTKGNGTPNGRQVTVAPKSSITIDFTGTADHVVLDDGTGYVVTTADSQLLTAGGTVSIPSWTVTVSDPT